MNWCYHDLQRWIDEGCNKKTGEKVVKLRLFGENLLELPDEIFELKNLEHFDCMSNRIKIIPKSIKKLKKLKFFDCSHNQISLMPMELFCLVELEKLFISHNKITCIPMEICKMENLFCLRANSNLIDKIANEILNCKKLVEIYVSNNPIQYISPEIYLLFDKNKVNQDIYNDAQSAHNANIQRGIHESIKYLMSIKQEIDEKTIKNDIANNVLLKQKTKKLLFKYMQDKTVHSCHNMTFEQIFMCVYNIILNNEHKNEIFTILNDEILDSENKCFTGRISRIVNTLNGFEKNIHINISESEQIGNICIVTKKQLGENYNEKLFKEKIKIALQERNYDENIISMWINNI